MTAHKSLLDKYQKYLDILILFTKCNLIEMSSSCTDHIKFQLVLFEQFTFPVNPCHVNDIFLYPLKTSENQRLFDVFRVY